MVRPAMALEKSGHTRDFASAGLIQLLVGPASSLFSEQMNVSCSVRATSLGCDRCKKLCGYLDPFSSMNVPSATIFASSARISSGEPSQRTMLSGVVTAATCLIHWSRTSFCSFTARHIGPKRIPFPGRYRTISKNTVSGSVLMTQPEASGAKKTSTAMLVRRDVRAGERPIDTLQQAARDEMHGLGAALQRWA